jgi:hypothetical protein
MPETPVVDRIFLVMRAQSRAVRDVGWDSEYGVCDEPGYVEPFWASLPAERSLLDQQVYVWGESEPWYPDPPAWMTEVCEHGLSAWLCEDPVNHYPRGM